MPIFNLYTNVCQSAVPPSLMSDLCLLLEKAMDVPAKHFVISIHTDQQMTFGNTSDPCAVCSLHSIGKLGDPYNENYTKLLCDILNKKLHISPERVYINFVQVNRGNVGWNNITMAKVDL
ncbi:macrophage migration inhibitory factor-like [Lithobates pipiens]